MSPRARMPPPLVSGPKGSLRDGMRALRGLLPYLWPHDALELRLRVVAALALLVGAKMVNIAVPFLYKHAVDTLSGKYGLVTVPVMLAPSSRTASMPDVSTPAPTATGSASVSLECPLYHCTRWVPPP